MRCIGASLLLTIVNELGRVVDKRSIKALSKQSPLWHVDQLQPAAAGLRTRYVGRTARSDHNHGSVRQRLLADGRFTELVPVV